MCRDNTSNRRANIFGLSEMNESQVLCEMAFYQTLLATTAKKRPEQETVRFAYKDTLKEEEDRLKPRPTANLFVTSLPVVLPKAIMFFIYD